MNIAATLLFLFTTMIPVAACSRLPQPAVSHGVAQSPYPSELQRPDIAIDPKIIACEPEGFIRIAKGACVGTVASQPVIKDGSCVCTNEAYLPVPNGEGFTCVHLISVFETIRAMRSKLFEAGIQDGQSEALLFGDVSFVEITQDGNIVATIAPSNPQLRDLSELADDLRLLDTQLRANRPSKPFKHLMARTQFLLEAYSKVTPQHCAASPGPMTRKQLFAHYPLIQKQK